MTEAPSTVEIRRYTDLGAFQADANIMAADRWTVAAQSETSGSIGPYSVGVAVITGFIGLLFYWPALLVMIAALIVGAATRKKVLLVTYRREARAS